METLRSETPRRPPAFRIELVEMLGGRTVAVSTPVASVADLQARIAMLEAENASLRARTEALDWLPGR